jgi:cytoskeletal protein CcmA (bactofilin family)
MDRNFFHYDRVTLYFTFENLERLEIEGGANLSTRGYIDVKDFSMDVEGGAKIELDIKADNLEIVGEGGFLFELNGVAENFNVKISGAGHVDADDLKAQNVDFKVEGFGTGTVYAVNKLNASIEGVGKIRYKGNPKVTQYIDGLGSVKRD